MVCGDTNHGIKEIESSTNKATLSIPEITKGVYLYRYSTKNKNGEVNYTGKLIKK
jgi:hypothetical protein